jgi:hypothetical protein
MSKKIGRNDPCPCGSGEKYKKCCIQGHQETVHPPKFQFEPGSYGDAGAFTPSIACLKLVNPDEWAYHFVLVKPHKIHLEEDKASLEAEKDLEVAFSEKERFGSDIAMAENLKANGYISVEGFNIVKYKAHLT